MHDLFMEKSKEVVKDFIQTAVIIDDRLFLKSATKPVKLNTPSRGSQPVPSPETQRDKDDEIGINAEILINSFADQGIICATLKYHDRDSFEKKFTLTATQADIAIIDWQLEDKTGEKALDLICKLLSSDLKVSAQHRLITIYTGTDTLDDIIGAIQDCILQKFKIQFNQLDDKLTLQYRSITITVLAKESTKVISQYQHAVLKENEIPERLIDLFTTNISGLLPNAMLRAISAVRSNTNALLHSYRKELDPAFITHRAMLPTPDDAGELLKKSIAGSLEAVLTSAGVSNAVNCDTVFEWLNHAIFDSHTFKVKKNNTAKEIIINDTGRKQWQRDGYSPFIADAVKTKHNVILNKGDIEKFDRADLKKVAEKVFLPKNTPSTGLHEEFSILTHHKSNFNAPTYIPQLTLGTIVRKGVKNPEYFLCIQQRCDSLRIKKDETRNFLFLPMKKGTNNIAAIVKLKNGEFDLLSCSTKSCHVLKTIPFSASEGTDTVSAQKSAKNEYYFTNNGNPRYYWVLDLKESHAQRIANEFSANLARVGLDESEWLRRS